MDIDKKTYSVGKNNYYTSKFKKTQILLAGSLRKDNFHIKRLQTKEYGKSKNWPTYSISRDGIIFQHYDPKNYSDFFGEKDIDKKIISIVLENMGMLHYDYSSGKFLNWINEECSEENIFEKKWNGYTYWEKYTEKQHISVVNLCKYLCEKYKIEIDSLGFNVFYDETNSINGIVTRSNYNSDFTDLNPSFDFKWFLNEMNIQI